MEKTSKLLAAGMGSALILSGATAGLALADVPGADREAAAAEAAAESAGFARVAPDKVEGSFAFTQSEASSNDWLYSNVASASRYLCGAAAGEDAASVDPAEWLLTVDGAVGTGYSATIEELAASEEVQSVLMGCSCAGNPADGLATANAMAEGISALTLIGMANPSEAANTVVFTSADGYQIALPLTYLQSRYCPLVFNVNGSPLEQSVGGTNQLWLGSTPASYFARDVVAITLEERETPPASPSSEEARAEFASNLPNIGVLFGGEVK